jgi:flagellar motor switch/type III secretory pathway protein FliN
MSPVEPNAKALPVPSLDLLFDVELEATIRFGGRQLLLRDILSMTPGSVVELDKRIDEPAASSPGAKSWSSMAALVSV